MDRRPRRAPGAGRLHAARARLALVAVRRLRRYARTFPVTRPQALFCPDRQALPAEAGPSAAPKPAELHGGIPAASPLTVRCPADF